MGSYCEPRTNSIDLTAGGLVWVRRPNGSWWPGRILSPDELPESYSGSPRTGTPVKLLGREDGSMDWYNLEKSKRIKVFRCGEYDECIEKAKASASHSSKTGPKAGKYARREDAILHALEIEKAHSFYENQEFNAGIENSSGDPGYRAHNKELGYMVSSTELSQSVLSFEQNVDLDTVEVPAVQRKRWGTHNDSEVDGIEGTKLMRGLHDSGLGIVYKRKAKMFRTGGSCKPALLNNASLSESNIGSGFLSVSTVNSSKDSCSTLKKRRPQGGLVPENLKRRNRRRQLAKVLESTARIPGSSLSGLDGSLEQSSLYRATQNELDVLETTESKKIEHSEVTNSSSSECSETLDVYKKNCELKDNELSNIVESIDNDCSDGFLDIPVVWKENQMGDFSHALTFSSSKKPQLGEIEREGSHCSEVELISQDKGFDETGPASFVADVIRKRMDEGHPKQMFEENKNLRCLSKSADSTTCLDRATHAEACSLDRPYPSGSIFCCSKVDNNSLDGSLTSDNAGQLMMCRVFSEEMGNGSIGDLVDRNSMGWGSGSVDVYVQSSGWSSDVRRFLHNQQSFEGQKESFFRKDVTIFPMSSQEPVLHCQTHPTASCSQVTDVPIRTSSLGSRLYNIKLEVQASYPGRRIPLVSLMSKLNGKAIVGHPISVKVLEMGHCDKLISSSNCFASSSIDVFAGRRKNETRCTTKIVKDHELRGGDPGVISKLQAKTGYTTPSHLNTRRKPPNRLIALSPLSRKKSSKIQKSGFSSRKIRKLSSIIIDHVMPKAERKPVRGTCVACVPLKLVFSRINDALNHPSQLADHI